MKAFTADLVERALWTLGGGVAVFVFESELGLSHLPLLVRALLYGLGTAGASAIKSVWVRNRFGSKGTASATRVYTYPAPPPAPCKLRAVK